MKDEQIEAIKNWPEPKSMKDIQVFLDFANFYQRFIQSFSKIIEPLTSTLKISSTTRLSKNSLLSINMAKVDKTDVGVGGGEYKDETVGRLPSKNSNRAIGYLTSDARQAFTQLRQAFTKVLILQHFDPECYIWIETDALGYTIDGILSQLTLNNLGQ